MKRSLVILMGLVLILSFTWGLANAYDQKRPDVDPIGIKYSDSFTYLRVVARGTAIGLIRDYDNDMYQMKEGSWKNEGSGIVVAAGYVLTVAHLVRPSTISLPETQVSTRVTDVIGITSRTVLLYDYKSDAIIATVLYENPDSDLAILKYNHQKNNWLKPVPYKIEFGVETLKAGDVVCAVVHMRDSDGEISSDVRLEWGTILFPEPMGVDNISTAWLNPWDITMDVIIHGGDSGSPLFVFRNGRPIMIGVVRAMYMDYPMFYSYAVQLPVVTKLFKGRR